MFVPDYDEDVENDYPSVSTSYKRKSSPVRTGTSGKQPRVSESRIRSPAIAGPSQQSSKPKL